MTDSRALIVSGSSARAQTWNYILAEMGWDAQSVGSRELALSAIADFRPLLMLLDMGVGEHAADVDESFAQRCRDSGLSVIPVFEQATPEDVAVSFRRGATDVLFGPLSRQALSDAIQRAGDYRDLYQENLDNRKQLEAANRELQDSLNILRMDQMAGRQIQLSLLPREPLVYDDYRVAHEIVPSLYLSGDFVGYYVVFDRFLLFYMADVSGHGASSAFVTIMLSYIIRQVIRRHVSQNDVEVLLRAPEGLIEHVNRQILALKLDKHLTIFAGSIDSHRHILRYVVGAQVPAPVMITEQSVEFLSGKGKPVGLFEDSHWTVEERALPPRFSLVAVSDGLFECLEGQSHERKEDALLAACRAAGPAASHDRICQTLGIERMRESLDDVSVLTISRGHEQG